MTAKIVNLNKQRKAKAAETRKAQADENALKFGRTKAEKQAEADARRKGEAFLDGHKTDE